MAVGAVEGASVEAERMDTHASEVQSTGSIRLLGWHSGKKQCVGASQTHQVSQVEQGLLWELAMPLPQSKSHRRALKNSTCRFYKHLASMAVGLCHSVHSQESLTMLDSVKTTFSST